MQHRFNNFFQYGQPQRKSNSKLAGVPSQSQYQAQNNNASTLGATGTNGALGGANARAGNGTKDAPGSENVPGTGQSTTGGQAEQSNAAQGQ